MELSKNLINEYEINNKNQVQLKKTTFNFQYKDKQITVSSQHISIIPYFKDNIVVRCVKKVSHAYLHKLKSENNIELEKPEILKYPDNDDLWGYCFIPVKNSDTIGIGEVHIETLLDQMVYYPFWVMIKRAEDDAISKELGLYGEGFLTEADNTPPFKNEVTGINYDDLPPRKVKNNDNDNDKEDNKAQQGKSERLPDPGENDLFIKKIRLMANFLKWTDEDIQFTAQLVLGKDVNCDVNIEELDLNYLGKLCEEIENEFQDDDLHEMLMGRIHEHKTDQEWRMPRFKKELAKVLDLDVEDLDPNKIKIEGLWAIITEWELWK